MARSKLATLLILFLGVLLARPLGSAAQTEAQATAAPTAELRIGDAVTTPLVLTVADLKRMPRTTLSALNPHDKKQESYEGELLEELLRRAGAPQGEKLRGPAMATYLLIEAEDGYRVIFSLAELDSGITDSGVVVADTLDGAALPENIGAFRLVAPMKSGRRAGSAC